MRAGVCLLGLGLLGCFQMTGGVWVTPVDPPEVEIPVPPPFQGDAPPELAETGTAGLLAAPGLDPALYFYRPADRWYRWAFNRWYVAFSWDGHWFPPGPVPEPLDALHPQPDR